MDENIRAVCSVPIAYCPPVNVMTRSTFAASSESADDQIDDTIPAGTVLLLVAAIVLVLAIAIAVVVKSGWDYKKWLFLFSSFLLISRGRKCQVCRKSGLGPKV